MDNDGIFDELNEICNDNPYHRTNREIPQPPGFDDMYYEKLKILKEKI